MVVVAALFIGCATGGWAAWVWQGNAYQTKLAEQAEDFGSQLAGKDRAHGLEREKAAAAALDQLVEQQEARRALEARLQEQAQAHWKEMEDVQQTQARMRDRLATADLRLSVLVDAGSLASSSCNGGVREAAAAGGMVHGAVRAELDRAHAQRIIEITSAGDLGLMALKACQAYVQTVNNVMR
nr:lysis protein [Pseudomonas asiatica]